MFPLVIDVKGGAAVFKASHHKALQGNEMAMPLVAVHKTSMPLSMHKSLSAVCWQSAMSRCAGDLHHVTAAKDCV
jgi:hypothetical protein